MLNAESEATKKERKDEIRAFGLYLNKSKKYDRINFCPMHLESFDKVSLENSESVTETVLEIRSVWSIVAWSIWYT